MFAVVVYAEIKKIAAGGLRRELPTKLIRVLPVFACIALSVYLVIDKTMVYQQSQSVSGVLYVHYVFNLSILGYDILSKVGYLTQHT